MRVVVCQTESCAQPREVSAERPRTKCFMMGSCAPVRLTLQTHPQCNLHQSRSQYVSQALSQSRRLEILRGAHLRAEALPISLQPIPVSKTGFSRQLRNESSQSNSLLTRESSSPKARVPLSHFRHCAVPRPATSRAICCPSSAGNAWKEMHCHRGRFSAAFGGNFWINST